MLTFLKLPFFLLFTFTSTNSTFSLLECLLCLFLSSFCSSSIHMFSFVSLYFLVSFTFRHFNFSLFLGLWIVSLFSLSVSFFSIFWIFVNFCKTVFLCFLLFQKNDFACFLFLLDMLYIYFPVLSFFSVSWEMVSRFCLNSPFLFSFSFLFFEHSISHLLLSRFDVSEKMFFQQIGEDIMCFFFRPFFLFFFLCSLVFWKKKRCAWNSPCYCNELFLKFLVNPFSLFIFSHEKSAQKKKPSFFVFVPSLFCFVFFFQHFVLFVHHFFLCSLFRFIFLFIPFCFSPLFFFSLFLHFFFISLSPCFSCAFFFSISCFLIHFSPSPFLCIFFLFYLIFSSLSLLFLISLFFSYFFFTLFFSSSPYLFFTKKIQNFSVVNFLKTKLCLCFLNPSLLRCLICCFFPFAWSSCLVCPMFHWFL